MIYRLRPFLISRSWHPARRKYAILLAIALLFAQYVLIAHQIDHQSRAADTACDMCLMAQHLGSTPVSKDMPPIYIHAQDCMVFPLVAGLLSPQISTGFFARAPPFVLHA